MPVRNVKLGAHTRVSDLADLYGCEIGDGTKVESFVYIESGVVIGRNCKIKAHAFIPSGITIEDGVLVGPAAVFTNAKYPRATHADGTKQGAGDWVMAKTRVGRGASVGAGAVILPGVNLGEHCVVGAGAVVTADVPPCAVVVGNPAHVIGQAWDKKERLA